MGLLSKTLGGLANSFKDKISQGIQGAKKFAGNAIDFGYNNSEAIGGALSAASPFISKINPVLGLAVQSGGSFLQKLKPGPVKDKLAKIISDESSPKTITVDSGVQQAVERKRQIMQNAQAIEQNARLVKPRSVKQRKKQSRSVKQRKQRS